MEFREIHCAQLKKGLTDTLEKGEVVTVYDKGHPRGIWRIGKIEDFIEGADGRFCGVLVRVALKKDVQRCFAGLYSISTRLKFAPLHREMSQLT